MCDYLCVNTLPVNKIDTESKQAIYCTVYIGSGRVGVRKKTPITRGLRRDRHSISSKLNFQVRKKTPITRGLRLQGPFWNVNLFCKVRKKTPITRGLRLHA